MMRMISVSLFLLKFKYQKSSYLVSDKAEHVLSKYFCKYCLLILNFEPENFGFNTEIAKLKSVFLVLSLDINKRNYIFVRQFRVQIIHFRKKLKTEKFFDFSWYLII
jgi:hypothetical protein